MPGLQKVNLAQKFSLFENHWKPRIAGEINDSYLKLVKIQGEFVWHHHDDEDELFLVVKGRFCMKLREGDVWIEEGEFIVIPKGVEHCPFAEEEAQVLLLEPKTTINTGNVQDAKTTEAAWI